MPFSQVKTGMKGYGVTVFEGTKLEKFDVEIVGVLNNIGPGQNLILARVDSPVVRRAGVLAGMSGSPIYIDGKVIGALAYAWQFAKEPVAGITPIDEMLRIAQAGGTSGNAVVAAATPRMTGAEFLQAIATQKTDTVFDKLIGDLGAKQVSTLGAAKRIALPVSMASFAPETIARFSTYFDQMGMVAVPSGSTATEGQRDAGTTPMQFRPGDAIGAVLLNGDFTVAATGTVTHIDGDKVYAFGHPFLDMGEISFPMARAEIVGFLPSLASSFKFANTGEIVGALRQDRSAGIMGVIGERARMIPVELTVEGSGINKTYHVNLVRHPQLSPLMLAMAADSVVANAQRAAGERTIVLESEIKLKGFEPIVLHEGWAGAQARQAIPQYLAVVSGYLMSNEFRQADIESINLHLVHEDQVKTARILEATLLPPDNGRVSPGDTVKVRALLKPFRGDSFTEMFDVKIPEDQPIGAAYVLVGSGTVANQVDFTLVPPDPRTLEQVVGVLRRLRPSTDLTVGLYSSNEGAVTAGVYLPSLPPSIRAVVSDDTSNSAQAPVRYRATGQQGRSLGYIVDGAVKIDVDVKPAI
ncbi:MAG TPA: SpoIVB peptidase S55 domain-containing protein [Thermoanaerobaculia bacterium]|nr:SpoIVB peptidase S55 domain-containing protein [Thermoanaerobaculia bacterium]